MNSSQYKNNNIVLSVYKDARTVYRLKDIAMLTGENNFQSLNKKLNYAIRTGKLQNPRKGIYTKPDYSKEELACTIYTPSYISLEYVLQKAGILFQYDSRITIISYLSRKIDIEDNIYMYRKIKGEIHANTAGIIRQNNQVNIASAERAFLDLLYLDANYYFDNLNSLNRGKVRELLAIYYSNALTKRVNKLFPND